MSMSLCYFVFNNLKVHPFLIGDAPLPGFELLSWDNYTYTEGTLWKLDFEDAGFSKIGIHKVHGQLWKTEDSKQIHFLEKCFGVNKGLCYPIEIDVTVEIGDSDKPKVKATTFALETIRPSYEIIKEGKWRF